MRGFLLGAIALAAGCGPDGVYIEVRVPPGMAVSEVDLYLATADCKPDDAGFDCEAIVPPREPNALFRDQVDGEVYFVDNNRPFSSTPDADGSAWFQLASDSQFVIKAAIAVGHDPAGGETGVAILQKIDLDVTQHVRVDLEPVASRVIGQMASPAVEVWEPPTTDEYRCVGAALQNRVVYIVPKDDPDCDQVSASRECLPGVHLGKQPLSSLDELAGPPCASTEESSGLCLLGGGCNETPDTFDCATNPLAKFCVPKRACTCSQVDANCLLQLFGDPATGETHVACNIQTEPDPNGGTRTCNKALPPASFNGTMCRSPTIAALDDGLAGFDTSATPQAANTDVTLKPITLGQNGCVITLEPPETHFAGGSPMLPIFTLLQLQAALQADPVQRSVIIPLKVFFVDTPSCALINAEAGCTLVTGPSETLDRCFDQI